MNFVLNILRTWCFKTCLELNGGYCESRSAYWSYIEGLKIDWTSVIYKLLILIVDYVSMMSQEHAYAVVEKLLDVVPLRANIFVLFFWINSSLNHLLAIQHMLDVGALTPFFGVLNVKNYGILWRVCGAECMLLIFRPGGVFGSSNACWWYFTFIRNFENVLMKSKNYYLVYGNNVVDIGRVEKRSIMGI